jgi:dethiobiotin synthase
MNRGYFVTATDTGAGKNVFAAGLVLLLRSKGIAAVPVKPVQTGMKRPGISPDLAKIFFLAGLARDRTVLSLMQPYCYTEPCSPHLAAERDKKPYASAVKINENLEKLAGQYGSLIVEGAGGVLVPVDRNKRTCMADIIKASGLPVILVSKSGLGAINHASLSIEALKNRKIKIAGFVLNNIFRRGAENYIIKDNAKVISQYTGVKYLGTLPYLKKLSSKNLLSAMKRMKGLNRLIRREIKCKEKK